MMERISTANYDGWKRHRPFNALVADTRFANPACPAPDRITASVDHVLAFLKQHPRVESVLFPLDESFPQYELAKSR